MEPEAPPRPAALLLVVLAALLAIGVRLSEDRELTRVAQAVRAHPIEHLTAAAGWALHTLWPVDAVPAAANGRCSGRRSR